MSQKKRDYLQKRLEKGVDWWIVILISFIPILVVDIFKLLKINGTRNKDGSDLKGVGG